MTRTVLESKTKTTVIGFDEPFCVIGERINPTGRKILNEELERGDFSRVEADAIAQTMAGANVLDINSGAVFSNKMAEDPRYADNNFVEPTLMKELVERVQAVADIPLCIDSSVPGAQRISASPPMTSSSTRWSCPSAPWARPGCRSSPSCVACARNLASTQPAARLTSASACPTATASTTPSCPWRWPRA